MCPKYVFQSSELYPTIKIHFYKVVVVQVNSEGCGTCQVVVFSARDQTQFLFHLSLFLSPFFIVLAGAIVKKY